MVESGRKFAVIGRPAAHSLSPRIHADFAAGQRIALEYGVLEPSEADFEDEVAAFFGRGGAGLNVTLPFKERALALADVATERASLAGAANTLWPDAQGIRADNTDGEGLLADLARLNVPIEGRDLLVLGAGGAARGIVPSLLQRSPRLLVIANRTMARAQTLVERFAELAGADILIATADPRLVARHFDLALNATSVGTATDAAAAELPPTLAAAVDLADFCYDLGYDLGRRTPFTAAAEAAGRGSADGLGMLVQQAALSFEIWHGARPDAEATLAQLAGSGKGAGADR